ncbi:MULTISPECIES: peptide-methionine (S)-S-oxide reductase MsrA [unclassified Isoptericola]|uniref:peptide-methionine (S)-S-oxide reductase MsrA n=1 Tax=unclassified Isoptericola TaxID=2623355 RepID=UPI002712B84F|nr:MULTISPECIES: peptide-methionine (S)-S-oxide reductase MsrA [unclassified Isoptericola]MDO8149473.1 peptide-methionine (S)-S-oxide reductase MsrA [Isoptericola sp. b515]MDO8152419.1 peptide-methionine (S)-S-oxide reductase MsrA [Isoptericola sp. b408]
MIFEYLFGAGKTTMVAPEDALPGREAPVLAAPRPHTVLGTSIVGPWEPGTRVLYVAMGCFWGSEEIYWQVPGVVSTAVGYMGGTTPNPVYEEVCTARTGHTETTMVAYDPTKVSEEELLRIFWERHDPTQGYRQGNDVGTEYRSAIYWTTPEQADAVRSTAERYAEVLAARGYDPITTEMRPAAEAGPFYYAEDYHQQYLSPAKNPHGYRCHATTGVPFPDAA